MVAHAFRCLLLLLCCLLKGISSKEQMLTGGFSLSTYNNDNALPQNSIMGMAFDRNGFLWLATNMGMVRFDGKNFREYNWYNCPVVTFDEYSLPQPEPGVGAVHFKQVNNTPQVLTVSENGSIEHDSLRSTVPCQFTTSNNHLFYSNAIREKNAGKYKPVLDKLPFTKGLLTINEKQAYFKDGNECYFLDEYAGSITPLPEITGHALTLQFAVGDVYFYVDDLYQVYAYRNGVLQKNVAITGTVRRLLVQLAAVDPNPVMSSLKIRRDGSHTLFVCNDTFRLMHLGNNVLDCKILAAHAPINDIKCMAYDTDNETLFVGTTTSGLHVLKLHQFERLFFDSRRMGVNSRFAQLEIAGGKIFTTAGILTRYNQRNLLFPPSQEADKVAMLKASDGTIWHCENDTLKRTDIYLRTSIPVQYLGDRLTAIAETIDKGIVYTTPHKLGLRIGNKDTVLLNDPPLLQGADILAVRETSRNMIWLGTLKGLFAYDLLRHTLTRLPLLNDALITGIYVAKDSSTWIGTFGQGFYKYYRNRFIRMPADIKKGLLFVNCFLEDRQGYFWLSSIKGLFRVAKKELDAYAGGSPEQVYYYYIDKDHGFTINEFNASCTPCALIMTDGRFSFPSLDGLIQFHPDSVQLPQPDNPIFIDRVTVDNESILIKDHVEESQDSNRLVFNISSPYFGNKANLRLEYAIPEIDPAWYPVDESGRLTLTKLPKGVYTLSVRKQESYAQYKYKTIRLTILPYWYETTWFRLLAGGLAIGAFLLFFRARYNTQVKRARLLEQKVAERTEQLSESNRVKELMITAILHDLRSPLRYLHILARRMYDDHKTTSDLPRLLLQFQHTTNDLYDFTQNFFVFTNMQKQGFTIHREKIVLRKMIGDIISLYEVGANIRKNRFINQVPANIILHTDTSLLTMVMRNLVDNANKYTDEGEIHIDAIQDLACTRITMTDTGEHMDRELAKRIQDKTYNSMENGHGWGYKIIMEILPRLNGTISIDTNAGNGNKITITLEESESVLN
jgi:signal transduction histidine kinase